MILCIFSVYDLKAQVHSQPFFAVNSAVAVRNFETAVNDQSTVFSKHPSDFVLYQVGTFDDDVGDVSPTQPHVHLGLAASYVQLPERK